MFFKFLSFFYIDIIVRGISYVKRRIISNYFERTMHLGAKAYLHPPISFVGKKYIKIGNSFSAGKGLIIAAYDEFLTDKFCPTIDIGNNVNVGNDFRISAINQVKIGNDVLIAGKVFITDHAHGQLQKEELQIPPLKRTLVSKGPVIIGNNVWVGEGVSILSGVNIGDGAIIGAHAVVTKNVPKNSICCGVPARVIKTF